MSEGRFTTSDGVRLAYRVDGADGAPTLLCVNSLGTDLASWEPQVPAWSRHHRVVRYDQRGHGRSETGDPRACTVDRLARDTAELLEQFGSRPADVCGLSLGAVVAVALATSRPERVRRLVLAATAERIGTEDAWRQRAATVRREGMAGVVDTVLARFFRADVLAEAGAHVAAVRAALERQDPAGYVAACDALAEADLGAELSRVHAPCLVLVGELDAATPPDDARRLAARLPNAELLVLPGVAHLANLEAPEEFTSVVSRFLDPGLDGRHA